MGTVVYNRLKEPLGSAFYISITNEDISQLNQVLFVGEPNKTTFSLYNYGKYYWSDDTERLTIESNEGYINGVAIVESNSIILTNCFLPYEKRSGTAETLVILNANNFIKLCNEYFPNLEFTKRGLKVEAYLINYSLELVIKYVIEDNSWESTLKIKDRDCNYVDFLDIYKSENLTNFMETTKSKLTDMFIPCLSNVK